MSFGSKFILGLIGFVILLSVIGNLSGPKASTPPSSQSQYIQPVPAEEPLTAKGKKVKDKHKSWSNEDCNTIAEKKIAVGMNVEQAKVAWGKPETINRSGGAGGSREQWVYPGNSYLYFTNGQLTSWQVSE